jgi:hypothetical protein
MLQGGPTEVNACKDQQAQCSNYFEATMCKDLGNGLKLENIRYASRN